MVRLWSEPGVPNSTLDRWTSNPALMRWTFVTWAVTAPFATKALVRWTNRPKSLPWMTAPSS